LRSTTTATRLDGAPDALAPDDGRDKLDDYVFSEKTEEIGDGVVRELGDGAKKTVLFRALRDHRPDRRTPRAGT